MGLTADCPAGPLHPVPAGQEWAHSCQLFSAVYVRSWALYFALANADSRSTSEIFPRTLGVYDNTGVFIKGD